MLFRWAMWSMRRLLIFFVKVIDVSIIVPIKNYCTSIWKCIRILKYFKSLTKLDDKSMHWFNFTISLLTLNCIFSSACIIFRSTILRPFVDKLSPFTVICLTYVSSPIYADRALAGTRLHLTLLCPKSIRVLDPRLVQVDYIPLVFSSYKCDVLLGFWSNQYILFLLKILFFSILNSKLYNDY